MPFFVRPVARQLCATVQAKRIAPNLVTALGFMDARRAGFPTLAANKARTVARPACQRALAKGGPVMMG